MGKVKHADVGAGLSKAENESENLHVDSDGNPMSFVRTATYVIATTDASAQEKAEADFKCDDYANDGLALDAVFAAMSTFGGIDPPGVVKTGSLKILGKSINLVSNYDFPPFHNFVLDAREVSWSGTGGLRFDSMMDAWIYLGVLDATNASIGSNISLTLQPRTVGPDNTSQITNSRIYISAIAGKASYVAGSRGIEILTDDGTVQQSLIDINEIFHFTRLIEVINPSGGHNFTGMTVIGRNLHDGYMGLREGDSLGSSELNNQFFLNLAGGLTYGAIISGHYGIYHLPQITSPLDANQVYFLGGATGNIVISPPLIHWTDNSSNTTNRVISPAFSSYVAPS